MIALGPGRRGQANEVCYRYFLQETFTCGPDIYSEAEISGLSGEWGRKMQFFYDRYKEACHEEFEFTPEIVTSYVEHGPFTAFVDLAGKKPAVMKRVREIRQMVPSRCPRPGKRQPGSSGKKPRMTT